MGENSEKGLEGFRRTGAKEWDGFADKEEVGNSSEANVGSHPGRAAKELQKKSELYFRMRAALFFSKIIDSSDCVARGKYI